MVRSYLPVHIVLAIALLLPCLASADWITEAYFSEAAAIDSLERFLVIQDVKDSTFLGYSLLRMGDVSGDGIDDIIATRISYHNPSEDHSGFVFFGGSPPDGVFNKQLSELVLQLVGIGDINGDGYEDFAATRTWDQFATLFYFGGPTMDDTPDFTIPGLWSRIPRAADLDADGHLDIALSESRNGGNVFIYHIDAARDLIPEYTIEDTALDYGRNLCTSDFNGDGYTDLAVAAYLNRDTNLIKVYFGGPTFDTIPDFQFSNTGAKFGQIILPLGDFDGDGYGDFFIPIANNDTSGIYLGGSTIDNMMDIPVTGFLPPYDADVGDFNHDGWPDLIWGYINPIAFHEFVEILLGGPESDSEADVHLDEQDIPLLQEDMGLNVACVGDFNGDGIDDFAFRSRTSNVAPWVAEINLFAGWDSQAADVPYEYTPGLPTDYSLSQNYPNPFNPTTTINFSLPAQASVSLTVYNMLGQEVRTLIDRRLPAGSYRVEWDGTDSQSLPVATGVYLYTLRTDHTELTRKMTLVR